MKTDESSNVPNEKNIPTICIKRCTGPRKIRIGWKHSECKIPFSKGGKFINQACLQNKYINITPVTEFARVVNPRKCHFKT